MSQRVKSQGLLNHPMLPRIVEAHLAGQSSRAIVSWLRPPVAHTTVERYIRQNVGPILRNAEKLAQLVSPHKEVNQQLTRSDPIATVATPTLQDVKDAVLAAPILALRENRVRAQQDRHRRLQSIIDERAAAPEMAHVPGGRSGLLAAKQKKFGTEYEIDSTLLSELREHEKQVAIELGQWQENTGAAGVSIQIVCPSTTNGAPAVRYATEDEIIFEDIGLLQKPV